MIYIFITDYHKILKEMKKKIVDEIKIQCSLTSGNLSLFDFAFYCIQNVLKLRKFLHKYQNIMTVEGYP